MCKRAIRAAIAVLRDDNAYDNLDCGILSIKRFPEEVRSYLIEAVGEVQDPFLLQIGAAAVAFLEDKLEEMRSDGYAAADER